MNKMSSEIDAQKLHRAIDDTNFPKPMKSIVPSSSTTSDDESGVESHDSDRTCKKSSAPIPIGSSSTLLKHKNPGNLRMNIASSEERVFDIPGTPKTPRTSTTPGKNVIQFLIKDNKKNNGLRHN